MKIKNTLSLIVFTIFLGKIRANELKEYFKNLMILNEFIIKRKIQADVIKSLYKNKDKKNIDDEARKNIIKEIKEQIELRIELAKKAKAFIKKEDEKLLKKNAELITHYKNEEEEKKTTHKSLIEDLELSAKNLQEALIIYQLEEDEYNTVKNGLDLFESKFLVGGGFKDKLEAEMIAKFGNRAEAEKKQRQKAEAEIQRQETEADKIRQKIAAAATRGNKATGFGKSFGVVVAVPSECKTIPRIPKYIPEEPAFIPSSECKTIPREPKYIPRKEREERDALRRRELEPYKLITYEPAAALIPPKPYTMPKYTLKPRELAVKGVTVSAIEFSKVCNIDQAMKAKKEKKEII